MDDSGYEVLGDEPPKKAKPVQAKPVQAKPAKPNPPPADDEEAGVYGVVDEPPAKRPEPAPPRRRLSEAFADEHDVPVEFRNKERLDPGRRLSDSDKATSRVYGVFLLGAGVCMVVAFFLIGTAPHKVFGLLGACAAWCLWCGLGLLLFPMPPEALRAFKDRGGMVDLFQLSPVMWKVWFGLSFVVVLLAVYLVDQVVVPVEPGRR